MAHRSQTNPLFLDPKGLAVEVQIFLAPTTRGGRARWKGLFNAFLQAGARAQMEESSSQEHVRCGVACHMSKDQKKYDNGDGWDHNDRVMLDLGAQTHDAK